jgi:hypothetical protein
MRRSRRSSESCRFAGVGFWVAIDSSISSSSVPRSDVLDSSVDSSVGESNVQERDADISSMSDSAVTRSDVLEAVVDDSAIDGSIVTRSDVVEQVVVPSKSISGDDTDSRVCSIDPVVLNLREELHGEVSIVKKSKRKRHNDVIKFPHLKMVLNQLNKVFLGEMLKLVTMMS